MATKVFITGGSGFIGSYLVQLLISNGRYEVLNGDIAPPAEEQYKPYWSEVDILDRQSIVRAIQEFQPTWVVHLAARTDTDPENKLEDYLTNTEGTENVLSAIQTCPSIERVVITSTQFVNQYSGVPKNDEDYAPHTVYGESKVITENMTRQASLQCCWTIIRPTNIWGPRHPRYPKEFWYVMKKGKYVHPGKEPVIRSYGYVGNVADQIMGILHQQKETVHQQVFYVGDGPVNLYDWVNGFSKALNKKEVRVVPRIVVKGFALVGEVLRTLNVKFPITLSRFKSMTHGNSAPMEKTFQLLGQPKYSLESGIDETVKWLQQQDDFWKS